MKRIKFSIIVTLIITALVFCLSACNLGDKKEPAVGSLSNVGNESFKGQISEESYTSKDDAAKAFLKNELEGKTTKTNFVSYAKSQDVPQEELEKLPLSDVVKLSDITSAEMGTITYELMVTGGTVSIAEDDSTRTQTIYFLFVGERCYYFVPEARNGEMLSNSYYKDFWDIDHYKNCTMTMTMGMSMDIRDSSHQVNGNVNITIEMSLCESGIHMKTATTSAAIGDDAAALEEMLKANFAKVQDLETYIIEKDGKLWACVKNGDSWIANPSQYDSLGDFFIANNQQPAFLDYTFFVKTDTGFKLDSTKIEIFVANYNPAFAQMAGVADVKAEYFVENQRMKSSVVELSSSQTIEGATMTITVTGNADYKDYGSTTVTLPDDLVAYLESL